MDHTPGTELLAEGFAVHQLHVSRVVLVFRLLSRVEMIEVADFL
jgi:hypothetical protein